MGKKVTTKGSIAVRNATTGRFVGDAYALRHEAAPAVTATAKDTMVKGIAARMTGSKAAAERWYDKPNGLLGGRTPKRAVKDGDSDRVVGLLLNVAGQ